jgi:IMP dehydrogenase/GMP reductase
MVKRINVDELKEIHIKQMYHDIFGSDSESDSDSDSDSDTETGTKTETETDTDSNTASSMEYSHLPKIYDKTQKKNTEKELDIECSVCFSIECYRIRAKRRKM